MPTSVSRAYLATAFAVLCAALAACSHSDGNAGPSPAPSSAATDTPAAVATASAAVAASAEVATSPEVSASPSAEPTATPDPNLLLPENGTIVRAYPTAFNSAITNFARSGSNAATGAQGPYVLVFEMPGVAQIAKFTGLLPQPEASEAPRSATIAVSTQSATDGYHDVAQVQAKADTNAFSVDAGNIAARWVRVTFQTPAAAEVVFSGLGAYGTLGPRPSGAPALAGTYIERDPYDHQDGSFHPEPKASDDNWRVGVVTYGSSMSAQRCYTNKSSDGYPGTFDGRIWTWNDGERFGRYVVNDEGSIIAGAGPGAAPVLTRITNDMPFCALRNAGGNGHDNVLVLDQNSPSQVYPVNNPSAAPNQHFDRLSAGLFDPALLAKYSTVMFDEVCAPRHFFGSAQAQALVDWVGAGHKLLITDSDECRKTDYSFLPYPFISDNPGARGASSDRLIEVENDALGSMDPADPQHAFDTKPWTSAGNQIGDANTVTSQDPHWCGHLFGTNANNVNGFMQMYASYQKGLIVYDGFDQDDDGVPSYQRMRNLELAASPDSFLPCTQSVALAFVIQPNRAAKFTPGKPARFDFPMELLANQGYKGHVTVAASGDFAAKISPASFDVSGGTQPLSIALGVPGNTKPGTYVVLVTGTGGDGKKAQASITIEATTPIKQQLKVQRRIRLYGIHFDVDSSHIQPQSEPVIKDVAQIMRDNPEWHFRIEGHTDSDGGLQHNAVLSQARAQAVVDDLVKRYHIARGRMVPQGFGYSRPVASNATAAGKALNRRVELVRL